MRQAPMHTRDLLDGSNDWEATEPMSFAPIGAAEKAWDRAIAKTNSFLHNKIGLKDSYVDEIALIFASEHARSKFIDAAILEPGISHFNAAVDSVRTEPIHSAYKVRYDFLQKEGKAYRVECMTVLSGVSPLHTVYLEMLRGLNAQCVVHFSFKLPSEYEYTKVCREMSLEGLSMAQECQSSYGKFSYWNIPEDVGGFGGYLKPRCNIRDSE